MRCLRFFAIFYSLMSLSILELSFATDTITLEHSLRDGDTLVSPFQRFELGFFSPGNSSNRYLGIWYYQISSKAVVWVANRKNPIADKTGILSVLKNGSLVLLNQDRSIVWSSYSSGIPENPVAQLLDTGNFVVRDSIDKNSESYLWQSFDYPSDTLLTGMKLGRNLKTGFERNMTPWTSAYDPSPGDFTLRLEIEEVPQIVISTPSKRVARSGPWDGLQFNGIPMMHNLIFKPGLVSNKDELYYMYEVFSDEVVTRLIINSTGSVQRLVWDEGSREWNVLYSWPYDICDHYAECGVNGNCRIAKTGTWTPVCECLRGYVPESQDEGNTTQTRKCVKSPIESDCQNGEGFVKLVRMKVPDNQWSNKSMNIKECQAECLKNCACSAYSDFYINGTNSGCLMWFGDLIDTKECSQGFTWGQDIFIRVPASELVNHSHKRKIIKIVLVVSSISGMSILGFVICRKWLKRKHEGSTENRKEDIEVPLFDLATIAAATNNFSTANMIGEGGFGPVYKGNLSEGQEIAVKKLSKQSGQGLQEFMNEVVLIGKLQHRNLVALVGSCIERDERMLIYEYMPNKSLDYFIFDQERSKLLSWKKRYDIIIGIARGLLYLHQDSKLQIVHRDLKTSNILLDSELNPKISDFGLARIFRSEDNEVNTKRVVGTYGYMSPEYATEGTFSFKSDVFSLGVLMLEIISGKRNRGFRHFDHYHNLIGHAWLLWNDGRVLELMDGSLEDSFIESQVQRCIQVGLLCVQKFPQHRPEMSSVVFMLANEEVVLPQPKQPGFFTERDFGTDTTLSKEESQTENALSITILEAR